MTITIPQNYNEITIEQMVKWNKVVEENQTSILEYQMVSILCNVSFIDVLNIPLQQLREVLIELNKLFESEPVLIDRFDLNGVTYGFIPNFDNLTTPEYIDLDTYAETDILRFLAVIYRPIANKFGKLYNIEDYNGTEANYLKMAHAPAMAFLGAKVFFLGFRQRIAETYPELFTAGTNSGTENAFGTKWGWYTSIDAVAGGDYFKHDAVYRLTIYQFLTHLEYLKDKNTEEIRQMKLKR